MLFWLHRSLGSPSQQSIFIKFLSYYFSNGQNVAHPLTFLSDGFLPEVTCKNLIPMIRHMTGSSVRDIAEKRLSAKVSDNETARVTEIEEKFVQLLPKELGEIRMKNIQFHLKMNTKMKKMSQCRLPEPGSYVRFKLVAELPTNKVVNYVIVRGSDVKSLSIHTLIKLSKPGPIDKGPTISKLLNVIAEFCGLAAADELDNVPHFEGKLQQSRTIVWPLSQCDQMAIFLVQYLAIPNFENFINGIKICQNRIKLFPIQN